MKKESKAYHNLVNSIEDQCFARLLGYFTTMSEDIKEIRVKIQPEALRVTAFYYSTRGESRYSVCILPKHICGELYYVMCGLQLENEVEFKNPCE